jgi:hypothetical protein
MNESQSVSRKKTAERDGYLFGLPVLTPEWQARRDDARQREVEKTQALRAARLAAQARARNAPRSSRSRIALISDVGAARHQGQQSCRRKTE